MKALMKELILILFSIFSLYTLAQDCEMYFPVNEGNEVEIKNYNPKDKLTGSTIQKVLKKESDGEGLTVTISTKSFDEKGKELGNGQLEVRCVGNTFYMDMSNYLDEQALSAYQDMELVIEANDMEFPNDMDIGRSLPDASITAKVNSAGMTMFNITVNITNRKIEGKESITTPAGTFECYKMSYDIDTKMIMRIQAHSIEWLAMDVGMVRTESYNKKGKLQGYSVLTSLKN